MGTSQGREVVKAVEDEVKEELNVRRKRRKILIISE